jgi:hypothetical protein
VVIKFTVNGAKSAASSVDDELVDWEGPETPELQKPNVLLSKRAVVQLALLVVGAG